MKKFFILLGMLFCTQFAMPLFAGQNPLVIFDQGHGQRFTIEQKEGLHLSGLASLFSEGGFEVKSVKGQITDEVLAGVHVLIISGAFSPFSPQEIDAISRFVEKGGNLSVMLHIPQTVAGLLGKFHVITSNYVLNEQENMINSKPKDFYVKKLEVHPLTKGLKKFAVHGGWALMNEGGSGKLIAQTSGKAWVDFDRDGKLSEGDVKQSFGVVIAGTFGKGKFVVFGDDAIFQNTFLQNENLTLGKNLVKWLYK
jgi:hypothetical protein